MEQLLREKDEQRENLQAGTTKREGTRAERKGSTRRKLTKTTKRDGTTAERERRTTREFTEDNKVRWNNS